MGIDKFDTFHFPFVDGEYEFYKVGENVRVRKVYTRHTKEQLKHAIELENIRKSNREFGLIASLNKQLRQVLNPLFPFTVGFFKNRLQSFLISLYQLDLWNVLGERNLYSAMQHVGFKEHIDSFTFSTEVGEWYDALQFEFKVIPSQVFQLRTSPLDCVSLRDIRRLNVYIMEVIMHPHDGIQPINFNTYQLVHQLPDCIDCTLQGKLIGSGLHVLFFLVFAEPLGDYKRKRSKQLAPFVYIGARHIASNG